MRHYKCIRCGHEWKPRTSRKPQQCPNCHNPYWDKPYTERARLIAERINRGGRES